LALPTKNRLKKRSDFDTVFKGGRPLKSGGLLIKAGLNNLNLTRFGFIVSPRVIKTAVARNALKRLFGEIIRPGLKRMTQGRDVVIVVQKSESDEKTKENLLEALKTLKIL